MCDDLTQQDNDNYRRKGISRRQFGAMAAVSGLALYLPGSANAVPVVESEVSIATPDGNADAYFVHPAEGKHPGVIVWPDILGLRPAFRQMGKRLAESGYSVLVVNPYYRNQAAPVVPPGASYADENIRNTVQPLAQSLSPATNMRDAKALVDHLDRQSAVDTGRKIGTTGYCMGGPIVMRTAAAVPERIAAAASFHGGGLVTEGEDSPHLLIPQMQAGFLIAIAENDDARDPEAKVILKEAFAKADLPAEIEVYEGAMHGWCPPDSQVYNEVQAEKAWARLLALFDRQLA
ncbi:dienelactone hydrolase family protein [Kineobactrum salinum]|uniref:Dienelactone hydrolase family protein n=1 Tax=Kineobactrum salinum TaxID=2708301 RepID=A0A6C0U495_9GAMM|nr:dienelactone hydrolase family protein [Kineobactrum salinum]QIB66663.1 dienelactone hydrolase family protein [Kineobactrum salinum]